MRAFAATVCAFIVPFVSSPSMAQEVEAVVSEDTADIVLAPTGEWKTIRRNGKCTLSRKFGSGDNATTLQLSQSGSRPFLNLAVASELVANPYSHIVDIQFGPNEEASRRSFVTNRTRNGTPIMIMYGLLLAPVSTKDAESGIVERLGAEREKAIDRLVFSRGVSRDFTLQLGSMHEPVETLSQCADEAYASFRKSSDTDKRVAVVPTPRSNPSEWMSAKDYPYDLIRAGIDGVIQFRLTVNEEGRAIACQITKTQRPQMFDDTVCANMMRNARFHPAKTWRGEPTVGFYTNQINFVAK